MVRTSIVAAGRNDRPETLRGRPSICHEGGSGRIVVGMQNIDEERRRRARNAAWLVGLGLLLINLLIGYPSCSQPSETEAPPSLPADPSG